MLLTILALLLSPGCATTSGGGSREPARIALHNASNGIIAWIAVSEPPRGLGTPARLGEIAPLAPHAGIVFHRQPDAPRLPREAIVRWRRNGQDFEVRTSLASALAAATADDTLVVEVTPAEVVRVYLVAGTPPPRW